MLSQKYKTTVCLIIILGLFLPMFSFAQQAPETLDEAKAIGLNILKDLPGATKRVWDEEARDILLMLWQKAKEFWLTYIWPQVAPSWEKKKPALEEEFKKERQEMQNDLWEQVKRFLK